MAGNPIHGRQGALYLSTSSGSTSYGTEVGYTQSWSFSQSRDLAEVTKLNQNSMEYVEGLVSGTVSAQGTLQTGNGQFKKLVGRFARVLDSEDTSDTDAAAITEGTMWLHLIAKPIDTAASSDEVKGQKYIVPILSNGLSVDVAGGSLASWSYDGTANGDVYFRESTDSEDGFPKKAY
jgi:hypothetical protein